jgi:CO/xanthine dehydrogenase FAD-binding subunit
VKPVAFDLVKVSTVEEACALLADDSRESRLLAGGQSLIPMLNFRLAAPELLIDINQVPELAYIREEAGGLLVGSMARQRDLQRHVEAVGRWSLLAQALPRIGHVPVRNRGTVGGSLSHADPAAELCMVTLALDARLTARSGRGSREIAADDFFVSYYTTALEADEILTGIRFPAPPAGCGTALHEVARRRGDFALVSVAALLAVSDGNVITEARLSYGSMASRPLRAFQTEAALVGQEATPQVFAEAAQTIESQLDPSSDLHASRDYRMDVAKVLTRRALSDAHAACAGASPS